MLSYEANKNVRFQVNVYNLWDEQLHRHLWQWRRGRTRRRAVDHVHDFDQILKGYLMLFHLTPPNPRHPVADGDQRGQATGISLPAFTIICSASGPKSDMIWKLRTILFWMHLAVGVVAGLFILNMAVSGILIALRKQITAFAERSAMVTVSAGATPRR